MKYKCSSFLLQKPEELQVFDLEFFFSFKHNCKPSVTRFTADAVNCFEPDRRQWRMQGGRKGAAVKIADDVYYICMIDCAVTFCTSFYVCDFGHRKSSCRWFESNWGSQKNFKSLTWSSFFII